MHLQKTVSTKVDHCLVRTIDQLIDSTLSASLAKSWSFADGIGQDQTAQNVQSDLDLCRPLVISDICGAII